MGIFNDLKTLNKYQGQLISVQASQTQWLDKKNEKIGIVLIRLVYEKPILFIPKF